MDPLMEVAKLPELNLEHINTKAQLSERQESYLHAELSSSMITLNEQNPSSQWELPSILPKEIYKLKWYTYFSITSIKDSNINISFIGQDDHIHINLIDKAQIDWAKKRGYHYAHLDALKFGLRPLVRPYSPASSLCVVIDTWHVEFQDGLIGGFLAPLHTAPAFETIFPQYLVSLEDHYIYDLLKAYILPQGFNMDIGSHIIWLKVYLCIRFGNDTLLDLQPHVHQSERLLSVVDTHRSKNATPFTFD